MISLLRIASYPFFCRIYFTYQTEEKAKFDGIFDSLLPVNGLLSGDKVKPVLINSKLPLDILGRVRALLLLFMPHPS